MSGTRIRPQGAGFTLVEVMVALVITAVIGVVSYRVIDAMLRADAHHSAQSARWQAVQLFLATLETDLRLALPRPGRDAGGTQQPALVGSAAVAPPFGAQLALMQKSDLAGAPVRRVAYRHADGRIDLLRWPAADLAPYGEPTVIAVLSGVNRFAVRYLGADGVWREQWRPALPSELPRGFSIVIELADPAFGGPIERIVAR